MQKGFNVQVGNDAKTVRNAGHLFHRGGSHTGNCVLHAARTLGFATIVYEPRASHKENKRLRRQALDKGTRTLGRHVGSMYLSPDGRWMRTNRQTPIHSPQVAQAFHAAAIYDDLGMADVHLEGTSWNKLPRSDRVFLVDQLEKQLDGGGPVKSWNGFVDVCEIYSPARSTQSAARYGLKPGAALDLATGWDFCKQTDRYEAWAMIEKDKPRFIMLTPECGAWSQAQHLNDPVEVAREREDQKLHLRFCCKIG